MVMVVMLFVLVTDTAGALPRVKDFSYPEKQAYRWWRYERHTKVSEEEGEEAGKGEQEESKERGNAIRQSKDI